MELALHLGGPAERLAQDMTENEFQGWQSYARAHVMPFRRIELYLAQVAWALARYVGGNKQATVADFVFEFGERGASDEDVDVDELKASIGFSPRKKKAP